MRESNVTGGGSSTSPRAFSPGPRKRGMTIGLVVFGVGSAVAAMADSIELLIAGRAIQGLGAAFVLLSFTSIHYDFYLDSANDLHAIVYCGSSGLPRIIYVL